MGSWTGKFDPLRKISERVTKKIGFDPSLASNLHKKIADKAHNAADTYLNQEPEGPGVKRKDDVRVADYSSALAKSRDRADRARRLTLMRSI